MLQCFIQRLFERGVIFLASAFVEAFLQGCWDLAGRTMDSSAPDLDPFKALNSLMDEDEDEAGLAINSIFFCFLFVKNT